MDFLSRLARKHTMPIRSSWIVVLTTGRILREQDLVKDARTGAMRMLDWTLDLVATGDIKRVQRVGLSCPDGRLVWLALAQPETAFQFKTVTVSGLGETAKRIECHVIGRITNPEQGTCECWIWDRLLGVFRYTSSIYAFGSWRDSLLPLGALALDVQGVQI